MNISWSFHELTKEADQITWAGSSDHKVDETTNKLSIVCQLTLSDTGVGILFDVSIEKGNDRLTLDHPELI